MFLSHANGISTASIDARIETVVLVGAGLVIGTVSVVGALDAPTSFGMVVGIADIEPCLGASTLGQSVDHYANRVFATLEVRAAVHAFADDIVVL